MIEPSTNLLSPYDCTSNPALLCDSESTKSTLYLQEDCFRAVLNYPLYGAGDNSIHHKMQHVEIICYASWVVCCPEKKIALKTDSIYKISKNVAYIFNFNRLLFRNFA